MTLNVLTKTKCHQTTQTQPIHSPWYFTTFIQFVYGCCFAGKPFTILLIVYCFMMGNVLLVMMISCNYIIDATDSDIPKSLLGFKFVLSRRSFIGVRKNWSSTSRNQPASINSLFSSSYMIRMHKYVFLF